MRSCIARAIMLCATCAAITCAGRAVAQPDVPAFAEAAPGLYLHLGAERSDGTIAIADVNGDGRLDIILSDNVHYPPDMFHEFTVALNAGADSFTLLPAVSVPGSDTCAFPAFVMGDLNEDGRADLVTGSAADPGGGPTANIVVLFGTATGAFQGRINASNSGTATPALSIQNHALALGDMNGDGHLDIVSTTRDAQVSVLLGDGAGHFQPPILSGSALTHDILLLGDITGDGKLDVITLSDSGSSTIADTRVEVNIGGGDGTVSYNFGFHLDCRVAHLYDGQASACLAYVDGDQLADLVVFGESGTAAGDGGLYVLKSIGRGRFFTLFRETRAADQGRRTACIALADLDGDFRPDIIKVPNIGRGPGEILVNGGYAGFTRRLPFPASTSQLRSVALGDIVGTHRLDAAAYASTRGTVTGRITWLRNLARPVCPADYDSNEVVDTADIAVFLTRWYQDLTNPSFFLFADFDRDGRTTPNDVAAYIQAWFAAVVTGC